MPDDTDGEYGGSFPARRRTLLGALAGGVGLSALGAAAGQNDQQEEPVGQGGGAAQGRRRAQLMAPLSSEEHDVDTEGDGAFHLRARGNRVHWALLVENLENVTAAHIHEGAAGESGPIELTLVEYPGFQDEDAEDGSRTAGEGEPLVVSGSMRATPEQAGTGEGNVTAGNATMAGNETNVTAGNDTMADNETNVTIVDDAGAAGQNDTEIGPGANDTGVGEGGLFGNDSQPAQNQTEPGMAGDETGGMGGNQTDWMPGGQMPAQNLAGGEGVTEVDAETLDAITQNPSDYYVNVHTTEHPDGALRGQLYDLGMVTQPPGQMPAANETEPGMVDNETGVGAPQNETGVGGPGNATNDTGVGGDNDTGGGILDGGDGGDNDTGGGGNGGGIFD